MNNEIKRYILTVAIPTYNGSRTITDTLDLLLGQYDPRVEILISDNHSIDDTPQILKKYMEKYPVIRAIRNDKNIGPDANFLNALRLATGKYALLLSDDDILIENSLSKIADFLETNPGISLAYLETIGFHGRYTGISNCIRPAISVPNNICTTDKKEFMKYAGFYWGFMSSFVCSKENFEEIDAPERYFGTYWLQSYIHILCSAKPDALMGVIKGPCIGAGSYINVANFDTSLVDGVYYRKMLDFAVQKGDYNKKQLEDLYIRRICTVGKRAVIKERAAGIKKTNVKRLVKCTYRYPKAWLTLYPYLLIPSPICSFVMNKYRKYRKLDGNIRINRPE